MGTALLDDSRRDEPDRPRVGGCAFLDELISRQATRRGNNYLFSAAGSDDWQARQDRSVTDYESDEYNADPTLPLLFGNFISVRTGKDDVVLDIGCGFSRLPIYVQELGLKNFIGLEPMTIPASRDYPCLVGAMAEDIPLKDNTVDVVLFSTSLDHIEDEDAAIAEVKRILKPGGRIMFWQGLYDPDTIPRAKTFAPIFTGPLTATRLARLLLAPLEYAWVFYRMRSRGRKLKSGDPIDDIHFRYYTRERMNDSLTRWGLVARRNLEIGTSVFIEASCGSP